MGHSSVGGARPNARLRTVRPDGTPVYRHDHDPGRPPVAVVRVDDAAHDGWQPPGRPHAHDFLSLMYVESGRGSITVDGAERPLRPGEVHALSPGQVVGLTPAAELVECRAWSVAFTPDAVPALATVSPLTWENHPLLALFADGAGQGVVPEADHTTWAARFAELAEELDHPERLGARDAVAGLLTRILVAAARLAPAEPHAPDPLVERVFDQIEAQFREPVSAADVARALGYTPGHLTTIVRERTGRPLLEWITERRMTEVRRLLRETDLPLGVVASRTGLRDASYLVRRFRGRYGTTPERWRRGQRVG
jgi:AraC-like DNA-binding protein